jgi:aspartyl-tRNA(Asn)/glutamyl-tRNA(Gln) amidotransferase subunit B
VVEDLYEVESFLEEFEVMSEAEDVVIGLEVHVQLQTESKLFCRCSTKFGADPNKHTCPVCMGLPGVLPVLNRGALQYAMKAARALNCEIQSDMKFDRKNYYYPDLPKAYQISQYDMPLAEDGELEVEANGETQTIGIERLHMEEDAGKLIHSDVGDESFVDYNRAGVPLAEIVSEPDIRTPEAAEAYLKTLKKRMEYIDVSDCNMEEGSLRCDANISIRNEDGSFGTKVEVKNMNSFKAVKQALSYETSRQRRMIDNDETILQGTRLWDEDAGETRSMREKEEAHDYRYFPEPDLVPVRIPDEWVDEVDDELPEMPDHRRERFRDEYELSAEDARVLTDSRAMADFFENAVSACGDANAVSNLMKADLRRELNDRNWTMAQVAMEPEDLAAIVEMLNDDTISSNVGSELIEEIVETGEDPEAIVEERDLAQISDEGELDGMIEEVIEENPDAVEDIQNGNENAIGFLVGQVMQKSQGQANPEQANEMLRDKILS